MSIRRVAFLLAAALMLGFAAWLAHSTITGNRPQGDKDLYVGGSILLTAMALIFCARCIRWRSAPELKAIDDPNAVVHLEMSGFESRAVALFVLVMAVGFGIWALGATGVARFQILGWFGVVSCAALSFLILITKRPASLHLSPEGLNFSGFGVGLIPWPDIRAARPASFGRFQVIALDLKNEDRYLSRRRELHPSVVNRLLLSKPFVFGSPVVEISRDMLLEAVDLRISAFGRSGPQPD